MCCVTQSFNTEKKPNGYIYILYPACPKTNHDIALFILLVPGQLDTNDDDDDDSLHRPQQIVF